MITLPLRSERPPLVRILVADKFTNELNVGGKGPWVALPMLRSDRAGYELMDHLTRPALPEIGECKLRMRFGVINGRIIGLSLESMANIQSTGSWASDTDSIEVPSLIGKEIRVQLSPDDGTAEAWRTVWWGTCEYETDSEWPAGTLPVGERICHCFDGLFRTKRWFMTRHAAYVDGGTWDNAPGHPGYNIGLAGKTLGNRESSGAAWNGQTLAADADNKFYYHTWQGTGAATVWTDLQAAEHALRVNRPEGQPQFSFSGSTTLLSLGASPWPIEETDTAWDVINRICARQRGRGLVRLDWADDSASPDGPLSPYLGITPQTFDPVSYVSAYNATTDAVTLATIDGADAAGTAVDVDLIGDHRLQPSGFDRSVRGLTRYDAVETVGERIQVLVTMSRFDGSTLSLQDRWSSTEASSFLAASYDARVDEKYRRVYQAYGLPRSWQGLAMDHNAGVQYAQHRVDYRCNDLGQVTVPTGSVDTSPLLVNILPDTPLLEGYIYSGATPVRADAGTELGQPDRRPPTVYLRNAANRYDKGDLTVHIKRDSIEVTNGSDDTSGARLISNTALDLGAAYNTSVLGITVAMELPHRLRFKSFNEDFQDTGLGVRNIKRIEVPDAHLWLASPGAIWDILGTSDDGTGCTAERGACGATLTPTHKPGILRDDRLRVSVLHALACAWYLLEHRPATWTIRGCGLLPSFGVTSDGDPQIDDNGTPVTYPTLGQLLRTLTANGQETVHNAPITGIIYNHQAQTTILSCDWVDLDVRSG